MCSAQLFFHLRRFSGCSLIQGGAELLCKRESKKRRGEGGDNSYVKVPPPPTIPPSIPLSSGLLLLLPMNTKSIGSAFLFSGSGFQTRGRAAIDASMNGWKEKDLLIFEKISLFLLV